MRKLSKLLVVMSLIFGSLTFATPHAYASASNGPCNKYHGRNYVICKESGPRHMPYGLPAHVMHPGKSSASGACGFLAPTRQKYGPANLRNCTRYMHDRYGTWERAERHHRIHDWW